MKESFREHPKNPGLHPISVTLVGQRYFGSPILKNPCDLWAELELIQRMGITTVIETGTYCGGSALFYVKNSTARVISVDVNVAYWLEHHQVELPVHERIQYLHGRSSIDPGVVEQVKQMVSGEKRLMLILDSCHFSDHVYEELKAYTPLLSANNPIVIEDSFLDPEEGPLSGIRKFFSEQPPDKYVRNTKYENFFGAGLTYNPEGFWIKRKEEV